MRSFVDWWCRDRETGEIVVAQAPNAPILIAIGATVLRWILSPSGTAATAFEVVVSGALTWWAVDEILRGVNPLRRVMGGVVLALVGWRLVR